jgi:hypothetical protein
VISIQLLVLPSFDCQVALASYNQTVIIGLDSIENKKRISDQNRKIYGKNSEQQQ